MAATRRSVTLNNGLDHPLVGFGTYKVGVVPASASVNTAGAAIRSARDVVRDALEAGYRCFDCAQFYGNEKNVGEALTGSGVARSELFLISKVWTDNIYAGEAAIRAQVDRTLADLGTSYLDLYLVHWPVPGKHVAAYQTLEKLLDEGKFKSIGLSNYTIEDYEELKPHLRVPPAVCQFEINPFLYRQHTIRYYQQQKVVLQSYRTLSQGKGLKDPVVTQLATKYHVTAAQILGRWCVQQDIVFLPKSENLERMKSNIDVFGFVLNAEDMELLGTLTTEENLANFKALYQKSVVRDTPLQESGTGVKQDITVL